MSTGAMSVPMALSHFAKAALDAELEALGVRDCDAEREQARMLVLAAKHIRCFYCLDYGICYKDREGVFANLDGCGNYDVFACPACSGSGEERWLECSADPLQERPGILKRGERGWMSSEVGACSEVSMSEALARKLAAEPALVDAVVCERPAPLVAGREGRTPPCFACFADLLASRRRRSSRAAAAPSAGPPATAAAEPASGGPTAESSGGLAAHAACRGELLRTVFAPMEPKFTASRILDDAGEIEDVDMDNFFAALSAYREAAPHLGKTVLWVFADFDANFNVCKRHFDEDPVERKTLRGFLQADLDAGFHRPRRPGKPFLKDPSGACQLQWLLRAMEFFIASLHLIFVEGSSNGFSAAYAQTLSNYHAGLTSLMVKTLLVAMPGKEGICAMQAICPAAPDAKSLSAVVCHDMPRATSAVLPVIRKMIAIMREMELWEEAAV